MGCASSNAVRVDEEEKKEVDPKGNGAGHHVHGVESHGRIINIEAGLGTGVAVDCEAAMKLLYRRNPRWRLALRFLKGGWKRLDNNDIWLPETEYYDNNGQEGCRAGDTENADICSVNSSFRFSFGSQVDWEACNPGGTTVLLVNLEKEMENNGEGNDIRHKSQFEWARIQSLERHVLPVVEGLVRFQYDEIRAATADFSQDRVLGRGAHSCVYRGKLRHGKLVAVKRLDKNDKEAGKDFCRELHIASGLKNRHVVPLVGFCIDILGVFLVYKFVSGGSLEYYLHDKKGKGCLSWSSRLKVAMGIAKAVDYLHHGTEKCVVHRDIKPSNILLSSSKTAMLCDFGLATWTMGASVPFLCKTVKGTFGYLAPEYFQHGKVSEKTDIYAFGVVLLELLTGRKPIETKRSSGDENLVIWARPLLYRGMAEELADPRLRSSYRWKQKEVGRMMRAALVCLHPMESWRPCMNQVLRILNGKEDAKLLNRARLTMFNVNTDCFAENGNGREGMKALKSHMALAMVGVDADADEERPDYKLDR